MDLLSLSPFEAEERITPEIEAQALSKFHHLECSLEIDPAATRDDYVIYAMRIQQAWAALPWYLGDLLAAAEEIIFGEAYVQLVAFTDHRAQTLADYQWIARAVPAVIRRPGLSHTHHRYVAALKDQYGQPDHESMAMWLERAERERWSTRELKRALQGVEEGFAPFEPIPAFIDEEPVAAVLEPPEEVIDYIRAALQSLDMGEPLKARSHLERALTLLEGQ